MALSVSTQVSPIGSKLVVDTACGATANNSATGAAGSIYFISVDNTANTSAVYLKIWDAASPTVGSLAPDYVFKIHASVSRDIVITEGLAFNYLSFACVTTGGTAGTTAPSNSVIVRMVTT